MISGGGSYAAGSQYIISATPSSGYQFQNWSGYFSYTSSSYTGTMPS